MINQVPEVVLNTHNLKAELNTNYNLNNNSNHKNTSINQLRERSAKTQYSALTSNIIINNNNNQNKNNDITNRNLIEENESVDFEGQKTKESKQSKLAELSNRAKTEMLQQQTNTNESKKLNKIILKDENLNKKNVNSVAEESINDESQVNIKSQLHIKTSNKNSQGNNNSSKLNKVRNEESKQSNLRIDLGNHDSIEENYNFDFEEDEEKAYKSNQQGEEKTNSYDYEEDILEESVKNKNSQKNKSNSISAKNKTKISENKNTTKNSIKRIKANSSSSSSSSKSSSSCSSSSRKIKNKNKKKEKEKEKSKEKSHSKIKDIDFIDNLSKINNNIDEDIYDEIKEDFGTATGNKKDQSNDDKLKKTFEEIEDEINYDFEIDKPKIEGTFIENNINSHSKDKKLEIIKEESVIDKSKSNIAAHNNKDPLNNLGVKKEKDELSNSDDRIFPQGEKSFEVKEEKTLKESCVVKNTRSILKDKAEEKHESYLKNESKNFDKSIKSERSELDNEIKSKTDNKSNSSFESKSKTKSKWEIEDSGIKKGDQNARDDSFKVNHFEKSSSRLNTKSNAQEHFNNNNFEEESLTNIDIANDESNKNKTSSLNNTNIILQTNNNNINKNNKNFFVNNNSENQELRNKNINKLFKNEFENIKSDESKISIRKKEESDILKKMAKNNSNKNFIDNSEYSANSSKQNILTSQNNNLSHKKQGSKIVLTSKPNNDELEKEKEEDSSNTNTKKESNANLNINRFEISKSISKENSLRTNKSKSFLIDKNNDDYHNKLSDRNYKLNESKLSNIYKNDEFDNENNFSAISRNKDMSAKQQKSQIADDYSNYDFDEKSKIKENDINYKNDDFNFNKHKQIKDAAPNDLSRNNDSHKSAVSLISCKVVLNTNNRANNDIINKSIVSTPHNRSNISREFIDAARNKKEIESLNKEKAKGNLY